MMDSGACDHRIRPSSACPSCHRGLCQLYGALQCMLAWPGPSTGIKSHTSITCDSVHTGDRRGGAAGSIWP